MAGVATGRSSGALVLILLVGMSAGCGQSGADQSLAPPTANCGSTGAITGSFDGREDQQPYRPGDLGTGIGGEPTRGDPDVLLRRIFPGLAAVTVVAREAPVATREEASIDSARSALPHEGVRAAPVEGSNFRVFRPTGLRVDRVIRGRLDKRCLEVDVPGGSAGKFHEKHGNFPDRISIGDRLLVTFFPDGSIPGLGLAIKADEEGIVQLPFTTPTKVDLDEWTPPPYEGMPMRAPQQAPTTSPAN